MPVHIAAPAQGYGLAKNHPVHLSAISRLSQVASGIIKKAMIPGVIY
ncbi:hypothetical protein [Siccibacter turicensis]|nr:hypothetical protein [Siccibacter turicensis]MDY0970082.1 hypothetical protein [Siccibacter turicensis]